MENFLQLNIKKFHGGAKRKSVQKTNLKTKFEEKEGKFVKFKNLSKKPLNLKKCRKRKKKFRNVEKIGNHLEN